MSDKHQKPKDRKNAGFTKAGRNSRSGGHRKGHGSSTRTAPRHFDALVQESRNADNENTANLVSATAMRFLDITTNPGSHLHTVGTEVIDQMVTGRESIKTMVETVRQSSKSFGTNVSIAQIDLGARLGGAAIYHARRVVFSNENFDVVMQEVRDRRDADDKRRSEHKVRTATKQPEAVVKIAAGSSAARDLITA